MRLRATAPCVGSHRVNNPPQQPEKLIFTASKTPWETNSSNPLQFDKLPDLSTEQLESHCTQGSPHTCFLLLVDIGPRISHLRDQPLKKATLIADQPESRFNYLVSFLVAQFAP
ncbi:MAG: hypothetical protein KME56_14330 [Candidatus Thiodiazotropha sp. (ex Ctena orbiculata)]|nr:hypothetical protein [Candidatus Thiodiazotropha taylori]MBT2997785.1 hypothetical protein [Candidatus Thiodiazotropha taylori]MBT3000446.1 hypothetical protein [Candidatus Thiodiazotropha taylori]MBV2107291.1 hypothetical protein [Candidatus Thiodiazotropha taylori]MBV2112152.1 hypothetical protein [Candidatus Thiodiazotropha taylori]